MRPLVLLPALNATLLPDGKLGITQKFLTGLEFNVAAWDGPVRVLMEKSDREGVNLDNVAVDPKTSSFELALVDYDSPSLDAELENAAVVHGTLGFRQNDFPSRCAALGVPFVTTSEYTLLTRRQVVRANTRNPILRFRRETWERGQERANVAAIRAAAGVQCNGTPTYEAYKDLNASPLLFFDTRTREADVLSDDALTARLARVRRGDPLKLLFSGRLDPMKGAQHLVPFATALEKRHVRFSLAICGGGSLETSIRRDLEARGLGHRIELKGVLDFQDELVPYVKSEADLFVCPHVQGDPSCTYMETMACGVPIAGFDNEAFDGIAKLASVGWLAPMEDVEALAERVAAIDRDREDLAARSLAALRLARKHTFEPTFAARLDHLKSLAKQI